MRIATYIRAQGEDAERQKALQAISLDERIAGTAGWKHAGRFIDEGSGADPGRLALAQALDEARLHRYDVLLVAHLDRLARDPSEIRRISEVLVESGVGLHTLDAGAIDLEGAEWRLLAVAELARTM